MGTHVSKSINIAETTKNDLSDSIVYIDMSGIAIIIDDVFNDPLKPTLDISDVPLTIPLKIPLKVPLESPLKSPLTMLEALDSCQVTHMSTFPGIYNIIVNEEIRTTCPCLHELIIYAVNAMLPSTQYLEELYGEPPRNQIVSNKYKNI